MAEREIQQIYHKKTGYMIEQFTKKRNAKKEQVWEEDSECILHMLGFKWSKDSLMER